MANSNINNSSNIIMPNQVVSINLTSIKLETQPNFNCNTLAMRMSDLKFKIEPKWNLIKMKLPNCNKTDMEQDIEKNNIS